MNFVRSSAQNVPQNEPKTVRIEVNLRRMEHFQQPLFHTHTHHHQLWWWYDVSAQVHYPRSKTTPIQRYIGIHRHNGVHRAKATFTISPYTQRLANQQKKHTTQWNETKQPCHSTEMKKDAEHRSTQIASTRATHKNREKGHFINKNHHRTQIIVRETHEMYIQRLATASWMDTDRLLLHSSNFFISIQFEWNSH